MSHPIDRHHNGRVMKSFHLYAGCICWALVATYGLCSLCMNSMDLVFCYGRGCPAWTIAWCQIAFICSGTEPDHKSVLSGTSWHNSKTSAQWVVPRHDPWCLKPYQGFHPPASCRKSLIHVTWICKTLLGLSSTSRKGDVERGTGIYDAKRGIVKCRHTAHNFWVLLIAVLRFSRVSWW